MSYLEFKETKWCVLLLFGKVRPKNFRAVKVMADFKRVKKSKLAKKNLTYPRTTSLSIF